MTDKFYNNQFGEKPTPPWKHDWPTLEEQQEHWRKDADEHDHAHEAQMHRCPRCGCLFTGGAA